MSMTTIYFAVNARGSVIATTSKNEASVWTNEGRQSYEVYNVGHYRFVTIYNPVMSLNTALPISCAYQVRWALDNGFRAMDVKRIESRDYTRKKKHISEKQKRLF